MKYTRNLIAAALFALPALAQSDPVLIPISPGPDGVFEVTCLSPDGSTVAGTVVPAGGGTFPGYVMCRWTLAAGLTVFPRSTVQPTWQPSDFPIALSKDGSIIGATVGNRQHMAARWSLEFGFQVAPQLDPGNQQTDGVAMSADGRYMVGSASTNNGYQGFRADLSQVANLNLSTVGTPPVTIFNSGAYSIDASGNKIVGNYQQQGNYPSVPCLWENGTTCTPLVCPLPLARWYPNRISGNGLVLTGQGDTPQAPGVLVPFRWSATGGLQLLPVPFLSTNTYVFRVDYTGQTLAGETRIDGVQHAVIWLPDGTVTTLDAYFASRGIDLNDFHFTNIIGLSADGKVLLAGGTLNGTGQVYMIRLPGSLPFCAADLGGQGGSVGPDGQLDNNDFIVFIADFFTRNARADIGKQGAVRGSDFRLDNNDFIVYIDQFFAGCQ